jgi:hypothetical protein
VRITKGIKDIHRQYVKQREKRSRRIERGPSAGAGYRCNNLAPM